MAPRQYGRITHVFQKEDDGAQYIGPYISSFVVNETVDEANRVFIGCRPAAKKFPQEFGKARPCLNYHIKRCMGVCMGKNFA